MRIYNLLAATIAIVHLNAFFFFEVADPLDKTPLKSLFFALQTVTTTGYGSGIGVSCIFMLLAPFTWGTLVAFATTLIVDHVKAE
jgi:hypothetical protein